MADSSAVTRWTPTVMVDCGHLPGKSVYCADDEKVGSIKEGFVPAGDFAAGRGHDSFLLDPGVVKEWFGGFSDVYLPESTIASAGDDRVTLTFIKSQSKTQGWRAKPANFDTYR